MLGVIGLVRPSGMHTCGWLTRGRFLFFASPKKRNQKKGDPDGAKPPTLRAFCLPVALRHIPVPECDPRDPSRGPSGLRAKACSLGRAIRGPTPRGLTPLVFSPRRRAELRGKAEVEPNGARAGSPRVRIRDRDIPYAHLLKPTRGEGSRVLCGRAFRGKALLVAFGKTKVTRGAGAEHPAFNIPNLC